MFACRWPACFDEQLNVMNESASHLFRKCVCELVNEQVGGLLSESVWSSLSHVVCEQVIESASWWVSELMSPRVDESVSWWVNESMSQWVGTYVRKVLPSGPCQPGSRQPQRHRPVLRIQQSNRQPVRVHGCRRGHSHSWWIGTKSDAIDKQWNKEQVLPFFGCWSSD